MSSANALPTEADATESMRVRTVALAAMVPSPAEVIHARNLAAKRTTRAELDKHFGYQAILKTHQLC